MSIDDQTTRERLIGRRRELLELTGMTAIARQAVALDQQSVGRLSRMDAMQQQAMAQANQRQRAAELQRIEAALSRLDDGDYGYCERCGEVIAEQRLQVDPAATMCVACAGNSPRRSA